MTGGANFGSVDPNVPGAEYKSLLFDPAAANWLTLAFDGDYDNTANTATASTVALSIGAPAGARCRGPSPRLVSIGTPRARTSGSTTSRSSRACRSRDRWRWPRWAWRACWAFAGGTLSVLSNRLRICALSGVVCGVQRDGGASRWIHFCLSGAQGSCATSPSAFRRTRPRARPRVLPVYSFQRSSLNLPSRIAALNLRMLFLSWLSTT